MPLYEYACPCGNVFEERRGYDDTTVPCPSCGAEARRAFAYAGQVIQGDTVPKGQATRAGNVIDPKGRYRVSLFKEATEELGYVEQKRKEDGLPSGPDPYKAGMERARRMGAALRRKG